jgi:hypothetical protein
VAVFGMPPYMPVLGEFPRRAARAAFLGTLRADGVVGAATRVRIRRPRHIWSFTVAGDGSMAIAGSRYVRTGRRPARTGEEVTIVFTDFNGHRTGQAHFRSPSMTNPDQPVLASSMSGGRPRFAAGWTAWLTPDERDEPGGRRVRVVLFE